MASSDVNKKIEDLQLLENQLQNFLSQKQHAQIEMNEIDNALEEIDGAKEDEVYKIISGAMIKSNKKTVEQELKEKKKKLTMQISSMEKQEKLLEKNAGELKKEIDAAMSQQDAQK